MLNKLFSIYWTITYILTQEQLKKSNKYNLFNKVIIIAAVLFRVGITEISFTPWYRYIVTDFSTL